MTDLSLYSHLRDNVCRALGCLPTDITAVEPIEAGLTNSSLLVTVDGVNYVYRHPGPGTSEIISREAEACALDIAKRLGLDETFIYEDPREGWKVSLYMEGCSELDYRDRDQVARALQMVRRLHTSGEGMPWSMDFMAEAVHINELLDELGYPKPEDHDALTEQVVALSEAMQVDVGEPVLCHNDFYGPNFLVRGDEMWLIDWEYAAMGDYACDIGNFVSQGSGYSVEETIDILDLYYGRPATPEEVRHCLAAVGIVGYYWYVWAMYQDANGNPVGEWYDIWNKAAKEYTAAAAELYR